MRFAKQQQWTVTNYTLLLMGAAYGLAKLTAESPTLHERAAWCAVVAAVGMTQFNHGKVSDARRMANPILAPGAAGHIASGSDHDNQFGSMDLTRN